MVAGWFVGDTAKTIFYLYMGLPIQFLIGGAATVFIDLIVLVQYFYYSYCGNKKDFGQKMRV